MAGSTGRDLRPAAEAAARWWAQALGAPKFQVVGEHASQSDREVGGFASILLTLLAAQSDPPTDEQADVFIDALTTSLVKEIDLQQEFKDGVFVSMSVDYHPERRLSEAAKAAGISTNRFPVKTWMHLSEDYVSVSCGHSAPHVLVWAHPDWERPTCESRKYTLGEDGHVVWQPWLCSLPQFHTEEHDYSVSAPLCAVCGKGVEDFFHEPPAWVTDTSRFHDYVFEV